MKLSAPVYRLKRQAKLLARTENIPLHSALDRVAGAEGYGTWSLLAAKLSATAPARRVFPKLVPGDLLLIGARPGHGKTMMGLELAVEAMKLGRKAAFFTLDYTAQGVIERLRELGVEPRAYDALFEVDCSDGICADYIVKQMAAAPRGTLIVVDYLQLLDQRRENPPLAAQLRVLKSFACDHGHVVVFISQIDRTYDAAAKPCPDIENVRLPNPVDVTLFSKTCFLNDGEVQFRKAG